MKFLAIGDFHGKCPFSIRKVVKDNDIDFILCTGDLCNANRQRVLIFKYWRLMRAGIQVEDIIGNKRNREMMIKTIQSQDKILRRLEEAEVPVFLIYGNNDYPAKYLPKGKYTSLERKLAHYKDIRLMHRAIIRFHDYCIIGISGYQPRFSKRKAGLRSMKKQLRKLKGKNTIFLTHEPPYGYLDKVRWKISPLYGRHIGNKAVLKIIRIIRPAYHICGHMHENQGKELTGRTIIVNHGPAYDGKCAIIDLSKKKVKLIN